MYHLPLSCEAPLSDLSCSKWFLQAIGHAGLNNLLASYEDKSAQAVCTFAYSEGPGHEPLIFEGRVTVLFAPLVQHPLSLRLIRRGRARLCHLEVPPISVCEPRLPGAPLPTSRQRLMMVGWDPIFEYEGETYAEMDKAKKNGLSHRALALAKLKTWLQDQVVADPPVEATHPHS